MSFFQTLLNSCKPFQIEKNHPDDYRTSFIYSAYNSSYPVVDFTKNTTTVFRKKATTETMLFLLAYGISYVVDKKEYGEFEYKGFILTVSKLLSESLILEVKNYGVDESFIEDRILNYAHLLKEGDENSMIYVLVLLNEQPLSQIIKSPSDFPKVTINSNLTPNLGEILSLNGYLVKALELMKQAMNKSYGLK